MAFRPAGRGTLRGGEAKIFLGVKPLSQMMAKRRKRSGRLFVPRIDGQIALGTLAASTMKVTNLPNNVDRPVWAISADIVVTANGLTVAAGDGPIVVGVCHGDYSSVEVEEWYEIAASWITSNKIGIEQARRKCRTLASFEINGPQAIVNDGKPIRVKLGFALAAGETLGMWAYNSGDSALTTGGTVNFNGKAFLKFA